MDQNQFTESGNSPPRRRENSTPLSTTLPIRPFSDRSDSARHNLLGDILHVHERLHDVWRIAKGTTEESREAGVLASDLWKQIIGDCSQIVSPCKTSCCVRCSRPEPPRFRGDNLNASDVLEIRENAARIGLHTNDGQCYCFDCVKRRNQKLRRKTFLQPDEWKWLETHSPQSISPQDRSHTKWTNSDGKKYIFTNVRCKVCGALDGLKYPTPNMLGTRKTKVCSVSESYLCDRDLCVASRRFKREFEPIRLLIGYEDYPFYKSPVHPSLRLWASKVDGNSPTDPNLSCELRYEQHGRGRKGIDGKTLVQCGGNGGTAKPSKIHTAEDQDKIVLQAEEIFHATYKDVARSALEVREWFFDASIHKIVHSRAPWFEEKRHVPIYNCFGAIEGVLYRKESDLTAIMPPSESFRTPTRDYQKTSIWRGDPKDWKPGYGLLYPLGKAFIIKGTAPYHITEYRDPEVSKFRELDILRKELRAKFQEAGWHWYSPNISPLKTITAVRNTLGGEDEIRQKQLNKLEEMKKQGSIPQFIQDIYVGGKSRKQIAKEQKTSVQNVSKKAQRLLNKPIVTEESQWARAIERSKCNRNGVYATANLRGHTKAYLILPLTEFIESFDDSWKLPVGDLHNVICEILKRRIKSGRMKDGDNLFPDYYEVYEQFRRFDWRKLWQGEWYREDQTEVPVLSTT